jgi:hypothetical protein
MAEQYFEMLWDCGQCAARGLLANAQRHCPMCGAAQDPKRRYFPEPGKEQEAAGHQFVGADWVCAFCDSPNAAASAFCVNCGGPKDGTKAVGLVQDVAAPAVDPNPPPATSEPVRPARVSWLKVVVGLVLAASAAVGFQFFSKHDASALITEKTWSREVDVERFTAVAASDWCDSLPGTAYQVSRSREQRSTRQVADGQECHDVRSDKGDGTFTKRQECSTRYRTEPVYDQKCSYRINRWQVLRSARSDGNASLAPSWPTPIFGTTLVAGDTLGAERLGARRETYVVGLQSAKGEHWTCQVATTLWAALAENQKVVVKVRGIGGADCSSLRAGGS